MLLRLLVSLLMLLALAGAPFGRMAAAEAMAAPHHAATAMAGHCGGMSGQDQNKPDRNAVDCMIACAMMAPAAAVALDEAAPSRAAPEGCAPRTFAGLHPESDPPPPRRS